MRVNVNTRTSKNGEGIIKKKVLFLGVFLLVIVFGQNFTFTTYSDNVPLVSKSDKAKLGLYAIALANDDINDFLIQDVCVDEKDRPLSQDPANCAFHRDLRLGEDLPYLKYTAKSTGAMTYAQQSYPVWGGEFPRFVRTMNNGASNSPRDYNVGDGYDVLERQGDYVSIMGTRDPVTTDENFVWFGMDCKKEDGWMQFPTNIVSKVALNERSYVVSKLRGANSCTKDIAYSSTFTYFGRLNYRYSSNVVLESIKTFHLSNSTPALSQSMEVIYYTRIYGLTRWEAWKSIPNCVSVRVNKYGLSEADAEAYCTPEAAAARASKLGTCNGSTAMSLFGVDYIRTDCVDNSYVQTLDVPLHAYSTPLTTTFSYSRNFLKDSDFASGIPATAWSRHTPTQESWEVVQSNKNNQLSITGNFDGSFGVYQFAEVTSWNKHSAIVNTGALINGPVGGAAKVQVTLLGENDHILDVEYAEVKTIGKWAPTRFYFPWDQENYPIKKIKFEYIPSSSGTYFLDEAFVSFLPRKEQIK